jgi:hypothetical protein
VAHLGLVLVGRMGRWKARRGSSAALGAGRRGGGEIPVRWGEVGQCTAGEASTGSPGRCRVTGRRRKEGEGAVHRVAPMAAGGGMEQWGKRSVHRGRSSGRLPLYGRHARAPNYRRSPRLNSLYGVSSTGACREPGGGPVGNPEREGRRGQGLHVAGHGLQRPSECSLLRAARSRDGARLALTPRRARRSRRRARHATPRRGTGRPKCVAERRFGHLNLQKVE